MTFVCMLLLLGILLHGNHAHPFSIITADGTCKPLSLLEKKWVEEGYTESAVPLAVTVLDADGTSTTSKLCNAILGTSFTDNDIGKPSIFCNEHVAGDSWQSQRFWYIFYYFIFIFFMLFHNVACY